MYNKSFARNQKLLYFKTYKNHFFFKWTNSIWTSLLQKQKTTSFYNTLNQSMKIGFIISSNISDNTILVLFHQDKSLTRKQKNNYFILDFKTYKNPFFCILANREIDISGQVSWHKSKKLTISFPFKIGIKKSG